MAQSIGVLMSRDLFLGSCRSLSHSEISKLNVPCKNLLTHGVVVGMTGSGKTGLLTVMMEEALRSKIPVLAVDIKGDLPNLLLSFPRTEASDLKPFLESCAGEDQPIDQVAEEIAQQRKQLFDSWGISSSDLSDFCSNTAVRVITPGGSSGELLHVLSSLERPSDKWQSDPESARNALVATVSLLLRLLGREPDPAKSKEHVFLSVLAERRLQEGKPADLASLVQDVTSPPIDRIGALGVRGFQSNSCS
jgi:hypothetical protein